MEFVTYFGRILSIGSRAPCKASLNRNEGSEQACLFLTCTVLNVSEPPSVRVKFVEPCDVLPLSRADHVLSWCQGHSQHYTISEQYFRYSMTQE
jgi:hypothetical protein